MSTTPRRLSKYELQQLLGHGNTGEVWQAYDLQARRKVAIKLLHPDLLQTDPNFMAHFMQAGQLLTSLHHPNIVQVHEVNISRPSASQGTTPYIVMDYIEGQSTLTQYIQQTSRAGKFPPVSAIVYLFSSLGLAIDYAHEQGCVHGDIRPANILLNQDNTTPLASGEPMLTDFGIANLHGNQLTTSPFYLSPEQVKGQSAEPPSDIYALGVMLYEICTGVLPFQGESPVAVMMHHINTLPTPPMIINPHIPPALSEIILRAMAKDPSTRFATASLLSEAIAEACSVEQLPHLTLNKIDSLVEKSSSYPTSGPLRLPLEQMIPILGVSQPLPNISSSHTAIRQPTGTAEAVLAGTPGIDPFTPTTASADKANKIQTTSHIPVAQLQTQTSGKLSTPTPSIKLPASVTTTPPPKAGNDLRSRPSNILSPVPVTFTILLLLLLVVALLGAGLLLRSAGQSTTLPSSNSVVGHVFFQDDALGHNDQLRIDMQNIPTPPQGKRYYAWLLDTAGQSKPLGPLTVHNGSMTLLYTGDSNHTNLLSTVRSVFVTLENEGQSTPSASTTKATVYQAGFAAASFPYIQHILYRQPNFPTNSGLIIGLFETIKGINDKAGSIVDSLQGTHDYVLAQRQATRIIELIDGSNYATSSGDLPADLPSMLSAPVGLISSPTQPGYIDTLAEQVDKVRETAGDNTALRQHAQNASNAVTDLRDWIQKMRTYDIQILKATDLSDPAVISTALQLKQLAQDAYTGRTIPPNQGPLPILGSAGAYQGYVECQYMATLDIKKI